MAAYRSAEKRLSSSFLQLLRATERRIAEPTPPSTPPHPERRTTLPLHSPSLSSEVLWLQPDRQQLDAPLSTDWNRLIPSRLLRLTGCCRRSHAGSGRRSSAWRLCSSAWTPGEPRRPPAARPPAPAPKTAPSAWTPRPSPRASRPESSPCEFPVWFPLPPHPSTCHMLAGTDGHIPDVTLHYVMMHGSLTEFLLAAFSLQRRCYIIIRVKIMSPHCSTRSALWNTNYRFPAGLQESCLSSESSSAGDKWGTCNEMGREVLGGGG